MDWHSRRDSLGYGTQENDAANPPGMESCLKKLGLDADWTVLGDPERDARSRWSSRRKNCTRWDADVCIFSIAGRPKRKSRARHFAEKREGYNSFMDIMFDVLTATKLGRRPPSERQLAARLLEYKKMLLIWADAHVIKMWDEVESSLANTDQDPKKVLLMWDSLLREMRKDLGKDDSELDAGDLVSLTLLAEEKHKVKN